MDYVKGNNEWHIMEGVMTAPNGMDVAKTKCLVGCVLYMTQTDPPLPPSPICPRCELPQSVLDAHAAKQKQNGRKENMMGAVRPFKKLELPAPAAAAPAEKPAPAKKPKRKGR